MLSLRNPPRRWASLVGLAMLGMVASLIPGAVAAHADPSHFGGGRIEYGVDWQIRTPGGSGSGGGSGSSTGRQSCEYQGREIDCNPAWGGSWSPSRRCYVIPEPGDRPKPAGATTGRWYRCIGNFVPVQSVFWQEMPPATGPPPSVVAGRAVASLQLQPITIGMTPKSGGKGLVGLPTWLWVDGPRDRSWGPVSASGASGPVSVSLSAKVEKIVWQMGDGDVVVCRTPGTKYRKRYAGEASPNCGHNYWASSIDQAGGRYRVRATSYWVVAWSETSGGGQSGEIRLELESTASRAIRELQVLVR